MSKSQRPLHPGSSLQVGFHSNASPSNPADGSGGDREAGVAPGGGGSRVRQAGPVPVPFTGRAVSPGRHLCPSLTDHAEESPGREQGPTQESRVGPAKSAGRKLGGQRVGGAGFPYSAPLCPVLPATCHGPALPGPSVASSLILGSPAGVSRKQPASPETARAHRSSRRLSGRSRLEKMRASEPLAG